MKNNLIAVTLLGLLGILASQLSTAQAQATAFTYQGRLNDGAAPANGSYDLDFGLWSAASGSAQPGSTLTRAATPVSNGLFTVTLDFQQPVPRRGRWLEIGVCTNGGGAFSTLAPRQAITPAPYAITAGAVTGTIPVAQLPASVATNGAGAVNLNGTFGGNDAGLTNLNATNLLGTVADNALSVNVALLDRPVQTFTRGTNTFSGNVGIGTTTPATKFHVLGAGDTAMSLQSADNDRRWTLQASSGTNGVGFGGKLGLGKTRLVGHGVEFTKHRPRRLSKIEVRRIKSASPQTSTAP